MEFERTEAERVAERAARARATLVAEFKIDAACVDVPTLARIVGLAPSTLYGYIRAGALFLPYRLVHGKPLVTLDDLVEWYCSGTPREPVAGPALPPMRSVGRRATAEPTEPLGTAEIARRAFAATGVSPLPSRRSKSEA